MACQTSKTHMLLSVMLSCILPTRGDDILQNKRNIYVTPCGDNAFVESSLGSLQRQVLAVSRLDCVVQCTHYSGCVSTVFSKDGGGENNCYFYSGDTVACNTSAIFNSAASVNIQVRCFLCNRYAVGHFIL